MEPGDDIVIIALGIGIGDVALRLDIGLVIGNYLVYLGILEVDDVYILAHCPNGIGIGIDGLFLGAGVAAYAVESQVLSGEAGLAVVIGGVDTSKRVYPYLVGGHGIGIQSLVVVAFNIDTLKLLTLTAVYGGSSPHIYAETVVSLANGAAVFHVDVQISAGGDGGFGVFSLLSGFFQLLLSGFRLLFGV